MATIPARMHFPYALRVAKRGFPIRRTSWTDVWFVWRSGVMVRIETGEDDRVVQSTDYDREDLLAWDWTTLASGCEGATAATDMTELLTVRPYDGLPAAVDPFGLACELPSRADTIEPDGWPSLGIPSVEKRKVKFARPPFTAPGLPKGEEWVPRRKDWTPATGTAPPEPPAASLNLTVAKPWASALLGDCIDPVYSDRVGWDYSLENLTATLTGGTVGATYTLTITVKIEAGGTAGTLYTGTIQPGETVVVNRQPWQVGWPWTSTSWPHGTEKLLWGEQIIVTATAVLGGSTVTGVSTLTLPNVCAGS